MAKLPTPGTGDLMPNKPLKFKQIAVGPFSGGSGISFTVIGLSEEGDVWRFRAGKWERIEDKEPGW